MEEEQLASRFFTRPSEDPILRWAPQLVILNHPSLAEGGHLRETVNKFEEPREFNAYGVKMNNFRVASTTLYKLTVALQVGTP